MKPDARYIDVTRLRSDPLRIETLERAWREERDRLRMLLRVEFWGGWILGAGTVGACWLAWWLATGGAS